MQAQEEWQVRHGEYGVPSCDTSATEIRTTHEQPQQAHEQSTTKQQLIHFLQERFPEYACSSTNSS